MEQYNTCMAMEHNSISWGNQWYTNDLSNKISVVKVGCLQLLDWTGGLNHWSGRTLKLSAHNC